MAVFNPARSSLALVLITAPALAQTSPKAREFTTDLGYVATAGNTRMTTFNLGEKLVLRAGNWVHRQQFGSVYGSQDGEQTSNLLYFNWRSDLSVSKSVALFALGGFDRNTFAGIARRFEQALGLAATLVATDANAWTLEVGLASNQQRSTTGSTLNFVSLRSGTTVRRNFSKSSYAFQSVEYLPSFRISEDYRVNSETGLVAPLSTHVSMKAGYAIRFDNLPEAGRRKSDRIFTTGLQFNW